MKDKILEFNKKQLNILPSKSQVFWHYFVSPFYEKGKVNIDLVGKWCLFVNTKEVDELWPKLHDLINENKEIISLKARTHFCTDKNSKVICVYVADYNDKETILKVRDLIRSVGYRKIIKFKTDQATRDNIYTNDSREFMYKDSLKNPLK